MRVGWAILVCATAWAQVLQQGSGPIRVTARCAPETVQALSLPCSADRPCTLYLELADVEPVGNRLILTGNLHTGSATLESILLASDDGGHSWTEVHARIPAAVLDQIQFLDVESGWINGHVLQDGPRDAFLLLTTDGGKTWRRRPISGEPRTGAIEQFWFDSRSHGMLALDRVRSGDSGMRYEVWESMTGGESWSVRQVNQEPLSIKRPERHRLWRIRPDATTHTNRLERRDGSGWASAATFAVAAGECKPEEPEPQQPPEPPPAAAPIADETPASAKPARPPSLRRPPTP